MPPLAPSHPAFAPGVGFPRSAGHADSFSRVSPTIRSISSISYSLTTGPPPALNPPGPVFIGCLRCRRVDVSLAALLAPLHFDEVAGSEDRDAPTCAESPRVCVGLRLPSQCRTRRFPPSQCQTRRLPGGLASSHPFLAPTAQAVPIWPRCRKATHHATSSVAANKGAQLLDYAPPILGSPTPITPRSSRPDALTS
jgi:hypothetical protein